VIALAGLKRAITAARRRGARVVFTNGVFDLLHAGHVTLLDRARRLGDLLVVGVNSDASVRRLKGKERPFVGQRERALMLASLESVDHVVIFGADTPLLIIRLIQPDVLVKGGDWKNESIVGREEVQARGGRVVRIPLLTGRSTTRLAGKIRDQIAGSGPDSQ